MKLKFLSLISVITILAFSCSKDSSNPTAAATTTTTATTKDTNFVMPVTFEDTNILYRPISFSSASSGNDKTSTATITDNPNKTGNTSSKVLKIMEPASGSTWGGAHITLKDPINFATLKGIKVKINSTKAGEKISLKLENKTDNTIFKTVESTITTANTWQDVEFNFSSIDATKSYQRITFVYEDNKLDGTTFYIDDISQSAVTTTIVAASLPMSFEDANTDYSAWAGFDGGVYALFDNPSKTGVNTSNKVAKYTKGGTTVWAGMSYTLNANIDFTTNKALKMKVYSPVAGKKVLLKIENGTANKEVEKTITAANTWEELEFYFAPTATDYKKLTVIFDNGTAGNDAVYYFDDITQVVGTAPPVAAAPTNAPTAPTASAAGVISLYSEAYTAGITVTNFNPGWGQSTTYSEETIAGNKVLKYANLNYQGTEFSSVNLTSKTKMHIDFWTPNLNDFDVFLISAGPSEKSQKVTVSNKNQWGSIDLNMSSFSAPLNLSGVIQMKIVGTGNGTLYLDNIYFY